MMHFTTPFQQFAMNASGTTVSAPRGVSALPYPYASSGIALQGLADNPLWLAGGTFLLGALGGYFLGRRSRRR